MKIYTQYNYDYSKFSGEDNKKESLTDDIFYESLYDKLLKFTSFGCRLPSVSNDQYNDDLNVTDSPGFDIADYPLQEKIEEINNNINNVSKDKDEKKNNDALKDDQQVNNGDTSFSSHEKEVENNKDV